MRLWLFHNGAASIPCEQCKEFVFNIETGEKQTYKSGPERKELPLLRSGSPTPCDSCPKESPERAKEMELTPKNWQAFQWYQEARATGLSDAEKNDPIVRRIFAALDPVTRAFAAKQDAGFVAAELAKLFSQMKKRD